MRTNPDEPAPSLRPHYRGFTATTSRSASRCRDGTQRLQFLLSGALPLAPGVSRARYRHPPSRVPCESRRPGSRRLHAGHRMASKRVSARPIPELLGCPGSDAIFLVSTHHQRFARARLPGPRLTRKPGPFPQSLTTTVFSQRSMRRLDASPRRATPGSQQFPISRTAPRLNRLTTPGDLLAFAAHPSYRGCLR